MIDEPTEELAGAYVLGALSAEESRAFDRQLQSNAELRELVAQLRGVTQWLAGTAPALEPSPLHRARLQSALGLEGPPAAHPASSRASSGASSSRRAGALPWAVAAALAAVCLGFGAQVSGLRTQLRAEQQRVEELNRVADALRVESADLRESVRTLRQSNQLASMRIALLNSQRRSDPQAVAVSVWDNQSQSGIVVVQHLRPPPKDRDYQLWVIDPRYPAPVDAGLLHVDQNGNGRAEFRAGKPIQNANQFAVTEEPKGGLPVPTISATVLSGA